MSAYGAISSKGREGESPLPTTRWTTRDKATGQPILINMYHLTLEKALKSPGLVEYLHSVFAQVVEDGRTYPMEVAEGEAYSRQAFESYFFAADVFVGFLADERIDGVFVAQPGGGPDIAVDKDGFFDSPGSSKDGKPPIWEDVIAGFYYVGRPRRFFSKMSTTDASKRSNPTTQVDPRTYAIWPSFLARIGPHKSLLRLVSPSIDLQRGIRRATKPLEQRLWSRSRQFVPLLWSKIRVQRERVQSRLCEQRREHQVRQLHFHQREHMVIIHYRSRSLSIQVVGCFGIYEGRTYSQCRAPQEGRRGRGVRRRHNILQKLHR